MAQRAKVSLPLAGALPVTASANEKGHLTLGGCDAVELASEFGTPLYVFDEQTLRHNCRQFQSEFRSRYADTAVAYAAKAYLGQALAALLIEEKMDLDVVSGGELAIARSVGFPPQRIHFHGNNKSEEELGQALEYGIGRVVVDNLHELQLLNGLATAKGVRQKVLLRLSPGVDPHTHVHTTTGVVDSKFGFSLPTGQAEEALRQALEMQGLELVGLHMHLGSPIFSVEPYREGINIVVPFAAKTRKQYGFEMQELSPGGGFAVQYVEGQPPPTAADYAEATVSALTEAHQAHDLPLPRLIIEPGRAIVAQAGVALYSLGSSKDLSGVRRYVSVDGGMADNIRPELYGAEYAALVANKAMDSPSEPVTIAGKYCESGDLLLRDVELPPLAAGDLLAVAAAGAYCLSMASNYNAALKPPIVMVRDGEAKLIRRRETYEDLLRCDIYPTQ